jgi:hypothetical protein
MGDDQTAIVERYVHKIKEVVGFTAPEHLDWKLRLTLTEMYDDVLGAQPATHKDED